MCLITGETLKLLKSERERGQTVTVLDMCSGKGGDFLKWKKGGVAKVVCAGNTTPQPLYITVPYNMVLYLTWVIAGTQMVIKNGFCYITLHLTFVITQIG